jgi:oligopeptide/dipeptide ABC transporter ATP-binding protein
VPPLLRIDDLTVAFPGDGRELVAVRGLSLEVGAGEVVGLVGESGSGKSLTALAVLGLVPPPGAIRGGSISLAGRELRGLPEAEYRRVRGARIGLVFQEPGAALNPVLTIGTQIVEAIRAHRDLPVREARERATTLLDRLAIPDARERLRAYPHELSGGQKQRALLAVTLASDPELLIADEPTTALDVTVQAQVLDLLERLRRERNLGILLITHDLGVVARSCGRVVVLYAGEVVEEGTTAQVLRAPAHPYTRGLLASVPRLGETAEAGALATIPGVVPSLAARPAGCPFHPRCAERRPECERVEPPWVALGEGRGARCVLLAPEAKAG